MIKKLFATYRKVYTNNTSTYSPAFFLDKQYADYLEAGLTATLDNEIPTDRYTAEIAPGIKKQTRFMIGEFNADYIVEDDYRASVAQVGSQFQIEVFATTEEACDWIKDNTDLTEAEPGKFEITAEGEDEEGNVIEARYITVS